MIATIVIAALIAAAVIAIIANGIRKRKRGECGCSGGCSACSSSTCQSHK